MKEKTIGRLLGTVIRIVFQSMCDFQLRTRNHHPETASQFPKSDIQTDVGRCAINECLCNATVGEGQNAIG